MFISTAITLTEQRNRPVNRKLCPSFCTYKIVKWSNPSVAIPRLKTQASLIIN